MQALLLLSLFMFTLAIVAEFGSLRAKSLRMQAAFDRAALAATGAIDPAALSREGRIRLDPAAAEAVAREYLAANLTPLKGVMAAMTATQVAAAARVQVAANPGSAVTVAGAIDVPGGLLSLIGAGDTVTLQFRSTSNLKGP